MHNELQNFVSKFVSIFLFFQDFAYPLADMYL